LLLLAIRCRRESPLLPPKGPARQLARLRQAERSLRRLWLSLHTLLVVAALVLLAFHVLSVYYF
jgi:hypothetical protein